MKRSSAPTAEAGPFLYSVRMRASAPDGRHVSGAERIVSKAEVAAVGGELLTRALERGGVAVNLTVDRRPNGEIHRIPCLQVVDGHPAAEELYRIAGEAGVPPDRFGWALNALQTGALPAGRAALVDASGEPREADPARGVRARHFDYAPEARPAAREALEAAGLGHFRTFEALALASKVSWAGVALEVCWSDEPDYLTGYVATGQHGYVRVPDWKPRGAPGGRMFFLPPEVQPAECIRRLEEEWALIQPPVRIAERGT